MQGTAPLSDLRIILTDQAAEETGLTVFKWTQLGPPYMRRSDFVMADYNPRSMDASAAKKLREGIKRYGLVERPIFNTTTGRAVGGHQRTRQMDKLMGKEHEDYLLPVNAVALAEAKEKELNVLLNNPSVQGSYDTDALQAMFESGANPFAAGFDHMELGLMFGSDLASQLAQTFGQGEDEPEEPTGDTNDDGLGDIGLLEKEAAKIDALKARKREQVAEDRDRSDSDHILHLVFPNRRALTALMARLQLPSTDRYFDSERFLTAVEGELNGAELA